LLTFAFLKNFVLLGNKFETTRKKMAINLEVQIFFLFLSFAKNHSHNEERPPKQAGSPSQ
jgi:hypothetical protein